MTIMPPRTRGGREEMNFSCSSIAMRRLRRSARSVARRSAFSQFSRDFLPARCCSFNSKARAVPIVDFLLETRIDLMLDLLDLRQTACLYLRDMRPRQVDRRERRSRPFEIAVQPCLVQTVLDEGDLLPAAPGAG